MNMIIFRYYTTITISCIVQHARWAPGPGQGRSSLVPSPSFGVGGAGHETRPRVEQSCPASHTPNPRVRLLPMIGVMAMDILYLFIAFCVSVPCFGKHISLYGANSYTCKFFESCSSIHMELYYSK